MAKKDFWERKAWMNHNDEMVRLISQAASVATQNNLAPHLSNRKGIFILPDNPQADYVLIDIHPNQDQYNFNGLSYPQMHQLQLQLLDKYQLLARHGDSYLYIHE